jgi:2-C-methyl-D-erythritol 4-phosphate cytidylyltransferase/2-C-methyl-D-erythritol 2,4-cyclodiphosphate synthase
VGSSGSVIGVVVGGGRSRRFGSGVSKQFVDLGGQPVIARAVSGLASRPGVAGVVVVLPQEDVLGDHGAAVRALPGVCAVVAGGRTRSESVRCGLEPARGHEWVLVHDAARPLASPRVVDAVIEATRLHGAAIPALALSDTVKEVDPAGEVVAATLDRRSLRLAQTPQGARTEWLLEALERARRDGVEVSDEAGALERAGRTVRVVAGDADNLNITTVDDLERARLIVGGGAPALRVGIGYDIHRFGADRELVLGGVVFPGEPGLMGHSDADVVLHAVMDAVLGAASLQDIGAHFPPGDPRYRDAASSGLAAVVAKRIHESGFAIVNVDVTVLAERPRIGPRASEMRAAIAACLAIPSARVGLKATTCEGLGALGRAEGIACQAIALLEGRP